jgi:outer membrane protein TolC
VHGEVDGAGGANVTPAAILELLGGLVQALPTVLALFQKASAGGTVTATDVQNALAGYETARAQLVAAIDAQGPSA